MDGISTSNSDAVFNFDFITTEVHVKNILFLPILAVALIFVTEQAGAQALKLGFVDSQKIFEGLPEAQKAQKDLDGKLQAWQDSLESMSANFQTQYELYQAQQGTMSEAANKAKQQELLKLQNEIQEYRAKKFGQTGEAALLRTKMLAPLQEKVLKAIDEIAKEEKLHFVFDKIQDASIILFADTKFDYTFKVLDRLKRGTN